MFISSIETFKTKVLTKVQSHSISLTLFEIKSSISIWGVMRSVGSSVLLSLFTSTFDLACRKRGLCDNVVGGICRFLEMLRFEEEITSWRVERTIWSFCRFFESFGANLLKKLVIDCNAPTALLSFWKIFSSSKRLF